MARNAKTTKASEMRHDVAMAEAAERVRVRLGMVEGRITDPSIRAAIMIAFEAGWNAGFKTATTLTK